MPNGAGRITSTFWTSLNICIAAIPEFIDWGYSAGAYASGIRWMNACLSRLGEMVNSYGGWKGYIAAVEEDQKDENRL
jgi:hypothetical protein